MKKIVINKDDSAADAVRRMLAEPHTDIVIVIPKGAHIKGAITNFYTIEKEATKAGRTVVIESVDDEVLAFARAANLQAVHPLFQANRRANTTTDIVFSKKRSSVVELEDHSVEHHKRSPKKHEELDEDSSESISTTHHPVDSSTVEIFSRHTDIEDTDRIDEGSVVSVLDDNSSRRRSIGFSLVLKTAGVILTIVIVIGGAWLLTPRFSRATVALTTKKVAWATSLHVTADVNAQDVDVQRGIVPAELFFQQKNFTQLYPASAIKDVSQKATGKITIFNGYSSKSQSLVASTRFATPDGKIFRLQQTVTVPGAVIANGKITPASVEATVVADSAGEAYNLSSETKTTIPGFAGTPKFDAFYGVIAKTDGGFQGKKPYPTADDIEKAKQKTSDIIRASLSSWRVTPRMNEFKIIDGTTDLRITKLVVNTATDDKGNFSVLAEGSVSVIAFKEKDVFSIVEQRAKETASASLRSSDFESVGVSAEYSQPVVNSAKKTLDMTVTASATVVPRIAPATVLETIHGQSVDEAKQFLSTIPDVITTKISLKPFWATRIPDTQSHINLDVSATQ